MAHIATLTGTVLVAFEDRRGHDCDCEVNVDYTFDGDDLRILKSEVLGPANISDWEMDELIWDAAYDHALDHYPEWLAEREEFMAEDRTVPPVPGFL